MAASGLNSSASIAAHVENIVELFISEDFVRRVSEAAGGTLESFELTGDTGSTFQTVTVRTIPANKLPDFAQKFVGKSLTMKQTDTWSAPKSDGGREVHIQAKVSGVPVEADAIEVLNPNGDSTGIEINGKVTCGIPFIGDKVARAAEPAVAKALNLQVTMAQAELAN